MAEPQTKTYACATCKRDFSHTFPKGYGRAPSYCPDCKAVKSGKPREKAAKRERASTALVTRAASVPAQRASHNGGGQRRSVGRAKASAIVLPATVSSAAEAVLLDLVAERDKLNTTIAMVSEHFGLAVPHPVEA